ncbi:Crp/Fnr family transcriptional regulator [Clostridium vincentii]|uniref:Cyclic nucleotide-binding domain protein n=1 Tax=Clostridium vincentii TaxID=52704 RepID=A0A2T0BE24_9CLOT|nr:Crp/Fnr family transcriptional regulator [Clostridium vincentii]PRR82103.1 Cyclic nucleotide-binding domain protein [Clostridium vincentii]
MEMDIEALYETYPILKEIDIKNNGVIKSNTIFRELYRGEFLKTSQENCLGLLFVIEGKIKIHKLNEDGEETNIYDIGSGELCHEALSCYFNCESLNVLGKALQNSKVGMVSAEVVKNYLLEDSRFLQEIYKDLYKKFTNILDNKEERVHESVEKRLIKLLLSKDSKIIYSTQGELAFEIDSAREVVSRKLKILEDSGYIKRTRGKIQVIKDLKKLLEEK